MGDKGAASSKAQIRASNCDREVRRRYARYEITQCVTSSGCRFIRNRNADSIVPRCPIVGCCRIELDAKKTKNEGMITTGATSSLTGVGLSSTTARIQPGMQALSRNYERSATTNRTRAYKIEYRPTCSSGARVLHGTFSIQPRGALTMTRDMKCPGVAPRRDGREGPLLFILSRRSFSPPLEDRSGLGGYSCICRQSACPDRRVGHSTGS